MSTADTASPVAGQTGSPLVLEVEGLQTHFPVRRTLAEWILRKPRQIIRAVDGVSLQVARGEILAVVGETGCGKTTTIQTIMRATPATAGGVHINGHDVTKLAPRSMRPIRATSQLIYQDPYESLDPRFRVRHAVEEPLRIHGIGSSAAERRRMVTEVIERVGLAPAELYADRFPHELSGGQRQRVAIAAALILNPTLLLADEPVSMLDVSVRAGVLNLLQDLRRESGMAIVLVTHDLATAGHFADRIAVMYLGRIVEEGPAKAVLDDPRHPYTKALLSVAPKRDPRARSRPQVLSGETPNPMNVPAGCRFHPRCPVAEARCQSTDPALEPPRGMPPAGHRAACLLA